MGGGMPISGCDGLQCGPRREPDAVVEPDKADDGMVFAKIGCELFKPECFWMFQRVEAIVGMCWVGGVSSAKTIIKGSKETRFSANNSL